MPEKKHVVNMRGINVPPENEAKFNKWYNEKHIPLILETGDIEEVTRYVRITNDEKYPKYLAIYKLKDTDALKHYQSNPQMAVVRKEMAESWPTEGFTSQWAVQYEALDTWSGKDKGKK